MYTTGPVGSSWHSQAAIAVQSNRYQNGMLGGHDSPQQNTTDHDSELAALKECDPNEY
jgi:hypothetical protein